MFNNPMSALIIGIAIIITALILKPCLEGRKCQCENKKQYRYQFIDNEYYWKEKVFDRETGVVYNFTKNEDGKAYRQDFVKGRLDVKERKEGYWESLDDKYDYFGDKETVKKTKEEVLENLRKKLKELQKLANRRTFEAQSATSDASTFRFDDEEFGEIEPIETHTTKKVGELPCIEEENNALLKQKAANDGGLDNLEQSAID